MLSGPDLISLRAVVDLGGGYRCVPGFMICSAPLVAGVWFLVFRSGPRRTTIVVSWSGVNCDRSWRRHSLTHSLASKPKDILCVHSSKGMICNRLSYVLVSRRLQLVEDERNVFVRQVNRITSTRTSLPFGRWSVAPSSFTITLVPITCSISPHAVFPNFVESDAQDCRWPSGQPQMRY